MRALILRALTLLGLCAVFVVTWNCAEIKVRYFTGLTCDPEEFAFEDAVVGSAFEMNLVLSNASLLAVDDPDYGFERVYPPSTIQVRGFSSSDCGTEGVPLSVIGPFPLDLEKSEEASVTVRFAPTSVGEWDCTFDPDWTIVELDHAAAKTMPPRREVCSLYVTAAVPAEAACDLQPAAQLDFGQVEVGRSSVLSLTIRNETADPIAGNQFKFVFDAPSSACGVFTLDPADSAGVIGPGGSKSIPVRFAPDAGGDFECTRSLSSLTVTDPPEPIANACPTTVTWRGTGVGGSTAVWSSCASGAGTDWHGVSGLSGGEIYVAGNGGSVAVSGGDCQWSHSGTAFVDANLKDIWAFTDGSEKAIWTVGNIPPPQGQYGETGVILKSDGGILWQKEDEGGFVTYGAVWGSALDDVYFVGTGVSTDFPNAKH